MLESSAFVPLWNTLSLLSTLQLHSHSQLVTGREQAIFTKRDKFGKVLGSHALIADAQLGWAKLWLHCQEFSSSYLNVHNLWPQSGSRVFPKPPTPPGYTHEMFSCLYFSIINVIVTLKHCLGCPMSKVVITLM